MDSVRAKHAAELEAKRRKLEEIRRRKAAIRSTEKTQEDASESGNRAQDDEAQFNSFIEDILQSNEPKPTDEGQEEGESKQVLAAISLAEKLSTLSTINNVAEIHIQPTLVETYTKHVQTEITLENDISVHNEGTATANFDLELPASPRSPTLIRHSRNASRDASSPRHRSHTDQSIPGDFMSGSQLPPLAPPPTEEEQKAIFESDAFGSFLDRTSRILERALASAEQFDVTIDYSANGPTEEVSADQTQTLTKKVDLYDNTWNRYRAVTDTDVSPFFPELILASYTAQNFLADEQDGMLSPSSSPLKREHKDPWDTALASAQALTDLAAVTEGLVLLWSTMVPTRPEYRFTCQSQVMSACFHPYERHLVVGGTYAGQLVVWDTRAKSAPVQKTSLTMGCHTHPIYAMAFVGNKTSHQLVTASTDGRVGVWDLNQLQQPLELFDLRIASPFTTAPSSNSTHAPDKKIEASSTTFSVYRREQPELYVGTEAGKLYLTSLDRQKSKSGSAKSNNMDAKEVLLSPFATHNAHFGPVTAAHFHPLVPPHRDGLLLTASLDSTVKLWSTEHPDEPVVSFEPSAEYVCDVRWSPVHASLFVVADGAGVLSLWHVGRDTEMAVAQLQVTDQSIDKVRWTSDGKSLIVGDANGHTLIYDVPSDIAVPQADELSSLESKVAACISPSTFASL